LSYFRCQRISQKKSYKILFHLIVQKEEQNTAYSASRASVYVATSFVHMTAYMVAGSSSYYKNVVAFAINYSVCKDVISKKNIQFSTLSCLS
jgi:hypothetical protein